jgi:ubiquitin thioesterase OTU1
LRELIADTVKADLIKYSEAFLGRSNKDYCKWIQKQDSWGGAIELSILSEFYRIEISVMDTQYMRMNRFGEDKSYSKRVYLIYDGIHYDALYLESYDVRKDIRISMLKCMYMDIK